MNKLVNTHLALMIPVSQGYTPLFGVVWYLYIILNSVVNVFLISRVQLLVQAECSLTKEQV